MAATKLIPYTVQIHPNGEASEGDLWDLTELQQYDTTVQSQLGVSSEGPAVSDVENDLNRFVIHLFKSILKLRFVRVIPAVLIPGLISRYVP